MRLAKHTHPGQRLTSTKEKNSLLSEEKFVSGTLKPEKLNCLQKNGPLGNGIRENSRKKKVYSSSKSK